MRLFLVRHGQSEANFTMTHAGQLDVKLTAQGISEAENIAPILADIKFDKVFSSDLSRAVDTQKHALPNTVAVQTPLLREYDVGHIAGRKFEDTNREYGRAFKACRDYRQFGGENTDDVCRRLREFLTQLEQEPCDNVAAFAHNGIMCCMLRLVFGCEYDYNAAFSHNCAINVFEFDGFKWNLLCWDYMHKFDPDSIGDGEKVLFLVRHGQSEANIADVFGGQHDYMLTPLGRSEAESIRPVLAMHRYDAVYASDLTRAQDTQKLALPDYEASVTPLVREIDEGTLTGTSIKDAAQKYGQEFMIKRDYTDFGGETAAQVKERVEQFLKTIESGSAKTSIVFAHKGTTYTMIEIAVKGDYDRTALESVNCGIHIFKFDGRNWRLVCWNYMYKLN